MNEKRKYGFFYWTMVRLMVRYIITMKYRRQMKLVQIRYAKSMVGAFALPFNRSVRFECWMFWAPQNCYLKIMHLPPTLLPALIKWIDCWCNGREQHREKESGKLKEWNKITILLFDEPVVFIFISILIQKV